MPFENKVVLPGSNKEPHPEAAIVGPVNDSETAQITLHINLNGLSAVRAYLELQNLWEVDLIGDFMRVRGRIGDLREAFTQMGQLDRAALPGGQVFRQRTGDIMIPVELDGIILGVHGIDDRPYARYHAVVHPNAANPQAFQRADVFAYYGYPANAPQDDISIVSLDGGFSPVNLQAAGVPVPAFHGVDGGTNSYTGDSGSADVENELDIQISGATHFFRAPNTSNGYVDVHNQILQFGTPVVSSSWGSPETQGDQVSASVAVTIDQMKAKGMVIFTASGDNGSSDGASGNNVDFSASAKSGIGVGGTTLVRRRDGSYAETAWSGSGGGVSKLFARQPWQNPPVVPNGTFREVPDVGMLADPNTGWIIKFGGGNNKQPVDMVIGGTSCAAPAAAKGAAILTKALGKRLGNFAELLYGLDASCFNDITEGNNGAFQAMKGRDLVTGLGSPKLGAILTALQGQAPPPVTDPVPPPVTDPSPPPVTKPPTPTPPACPACKIPAMTIAVRQMILAINGWNTSDQSDLSYAKWRGQYDSANAIYQEDSAELPNGGATPNTVNVQAPEWPGRVPDWYVLS